jgi:protein-disulfide isomerase
MAKKHKNGAKTNKKEQRRQEQANAQRLRWMRIGGIAVLILAAGALIVFWRNAGRITADEAAALLPPNRIGSVDAPVQVVEFGDFGCHACRDWHNRGIKEQLLADYGDQISFQFRHFPVITQQSPHAAEAAQCAAEQDAFWPYHDFIYEQTPQGALSESDLKAYAAATGLDQEVFDSCLASGRFEDLVRRDRRDAQNAGARGTPTFLINGSQVFPTYNAMTEAIDDILGTS